MNPATDVTTDAPTDQLCTAPSAPISNPTIDQQLRHRTIRQYQDKPLPAEVLDTLLTVARHGATSSFFQHFSIIHVTDPAVREQMYLSSGQPYVGGTKADLFVFVIDLHRNAEIRRAAGKDLEPLTRTGVFFQGYQDTMIAAQNMVVAAESMGLGTTYLGSLTNDVERVIEALKLPDYTFPAVGMLVGYPDQTPQFKPRLPRALTVGENAYPELGEHAEELAAYDQTVQEYYDLRDANNRVDSFSNQVANNLGKGPFVESDVRAVLHRQGLCLK
ncbi:NADPH-dependent oxidoreductase [Corynebacterium vitaeruminis]|uniref:NADPH-dependent oxidoreductase n=1 Tax=Corynebacterium vitaeruminis TaxID=38305 RepID=UPI0023F1B821|nr:NADPH-dependent oxidoreductase [Corynebacterium vitaeruminis]